MKPIPYADRTTVPVEQTKAKIERTLTRYGADRFAYFVEPKGAVVIFEAHGRRLLSGNGGTGLASVRSSTKRRDKG